MTKAGQFGAALLVLLAVYCAAQDKPSEKVFPMSKGTTWVYSAHVKWGKPGTEATASKDLRWIVTVADAAQNGDIAAALLKGGPWDLAWYEPNVKPQEHLIVRIGATYYLLHDEAAATFADIKAGKTSDLTERLADDIWFQMPIEISDNFCAPEAEERAPMGCWSVEKITTTHSLRVPGLPPTPEATEYVLFFMTNPDTEMVTLVPGVGIFSWQYQHHGTVAEASLKLVEYRAPGARVLRRPLASKH